jgi:hypothetical protein
MSKVNTIARLDPRIVYTGAAWANLGTAEQAPVAGGVGDATNATNGRGQFGVGSGALNGYSIMKGTGAGITPMVSGVDFTYDSRLDTTGGSNVNVYDTGTASNLASGKYFRIVEGAGNIASSIYPKSPGTPSYGLQIVAKDLTTEVSPPETQCYVDPVKGKFVLPRPIYFSKMESLANATTSAEIGSATEGGGGGAPSSHPTYAKFGNCWYQASAGNIGHRNYFLINDSILPSGTISFWGRAYGWHEIYLDTATNTYIKIYDSSAIYINGVSVDTGTASIPVAHRYIVWDYNKGLTGGKSIIVYDNGVEIMSTTASLPVFSSNIRFSGYINITQLSWDNIKVWKEVVGNSSNYSSWEYNSGTGRESALHYIYGSANNYAPAITGTNNGVCYDWTALPTDPVKLIKGSDQTVTLENASNISVGSGTFGSPSNLSTSAFVQLAAGTHFQYDKRLDASTTEDATNGFGATAGGIIDTGTSGSLSSGKYIRVVENTKNVVDATGLNLDIYAKQLVSATLLAPPSGQCYVDPANGRVILPRPIYWSKCESDAGITTGEIGTATTVVSGTAPTFVSGKFGNAIRAGYSSGGIINWESIQPAVSDLTQVTFSLWAFIYTFGYIGGNYVAYIKIILNDLFYVNIGSNYLAGTSFIDVYVNGSLASSVTGISLFSSFKHIYGCANSSGIKIYLDGSLALNYTYSFSSIEPKFVVNGARTSGQWLYQLTMDNLKVWVDYIDTPTWEYNSGTGRESALHSIYGATSGYEYVPKLVSPGGVGYYKAGSSGNYATMTF